MISKDGVKVLYARPSQHLEIKKERRNQQRKVRVKNTVR